MTPTIIIAVILSAIAGSLGQLFFKMYINKVGDFHLSDILFNQLILMGLFCYLGYFLFLIYAYSSGGKLSVVFPLTSLSYVITPMLGWFVLHERFGLLIPIGIISILVGCFFLA
jgi:drug/metabolite transporter (DMT)-like permease